MKTLNILTISILLAGCGGNDFTSSTSLNKAGSAGLGEAGDNSAGSLNKAGNSSVGGNNESGGSAGLENLGGMNSAGNDSVGGNNAGTGGIVNSAGTSGANDGGAPACVPINCDKYNSDLGKIGYTWSDTILSNIINTDISRPYYGFPRKYVACGPMNNGCGGTVDCGTCQNPYEQCFYGESYAKNYHYNYDTGSHTVTLAGDGPNPNQPYPPRATNTCAAGCAWVPVLNCRDFITQQKLTTVSTFDMNTYDDTSKQYGDYDAYTCFDNNNMRKSGDYNFNVTNINPPANNCYLATGGIVGANSTFCCKPR